MTKTIIDVFNELFDEDFFGKCYQELQKREKQKDDDRNIPDEYYHLTKDEYKDAVHTYHKEKEVVNGEVTKNESFTNCIEDEKKCCNKKCSHGNKKCCEDDDKEFSIELDIEDNKHKINSWYENKLRETNDLLEKANKTIYIQENQLKEKEIEINNLQKKLNTIRNCF